MSLAARFASKGLLCWFAMVLAPSAAAQSTTSRFVLTYDPGSEPERQAVAAVRAHIRGLPVELIVETEETERDVGERLTESGSLAASHEALGTFSIEQDTDHSILVFFTEPGGSATLVRRLPASRRGDRVAIEQAAIVVRSLVEALLEGGRLGIVPARDERNETSRGEAPAARRPPVPADESNPAARTKTTAAERGPEADASAPSESSGERARSTERHFFVLLGYSGAHSGGELPWQSGLMLGVRWLAVPTAYVGARYTLIPASELEAATTRISLARRPIELLVGYVTGGEILANLEVSAIAEQSSRETLATDAGFEPTPPSSHWSFGVGPRVGAIWAPGSAFRCAVRAGADWMLLQPTYRTDEQVVADLASIRPRLELELGVGLW